MLHADLATKAGGRSRGFGVVSFKTQRFVKIESSSSLVACRFALQCFDSTIVFL